VDKEIPFPEAGQASSIFSLTALFGPYLVMALIFGVSALLGLAAGSIVGLVFVSRNISKSNCRSFEDFLSKRIQPQTGQGRFMLRFIALTQLLFALSELFILRDLSATWLGMNGPTASFFAISVATVAYLYCLDGGYLAVFRTDIIQLIFVIALSFIVCFSGYVQGEFKLENLNLGGQQPQFWISTFDFTPLVFLLNATVSFVMGLGFILATPDTWKRIYVTSIRRKKYPIVSLIVAGNIPFLIILPIALFGGNVSDQEFLQLRFIFDWVGPQDGLVQLFVLLGFVSSFLSSFDSSLLNAAHALHLSGPVQSQNTNSPSGLRSFHWNLGSIFLILNLLFAAYLVYGIQNPYLLANILLGNFVVIAALVLGLFLQNASMKLPDIAVMVIVPVSLWTAYILTRPLILQAPARDQMRSIPWGVSLFLLMLLIIKMKRANR